MKEYKLKINNNKYTVVIKDVTDDAVLAEVNGKQHIVNIDTIANLSAAVDPKPNAPISASHPSPAIPKAPSTVPRSNSISTPTPPCYGPSVTTSV